MRILSYPVSRVNGHTRVPGDKSISHRAAILGAMATGVTEVRGFLNSLDCRATLDAIGALGVSVEADWQNETGDLRIDGSGRFKAPPSPLDFGNSGTSLRLMSGLLCGQNFSSVLTGDRSLCSRPMQRITEPLALMGADISTASGGTPPVKIHPVPKLRCIDYRLPVASAQVKSCLLLATLLAEGETVLIEDTPTRDHTEKMLEFFGASISVSRGKVYLEGKTPLQPASISVPGDLSSAAFLIVAACIAEQGELMIERVGINPTRTGVIDILRRMGADIEIVDCRNLGCEVVADLLVRSSPLRGVVISGEAVANAIDEFPILFVAAACAEGTTELSGAAELRFKESDRIRVMAEGLAACGVDVESRPDGLAIQGGGIKGGHVNSHGDHRVAMSFVVAGSAARESVAVDGCASIDTSFPDFFTTVRKVGFILEKK